MVFDLTLSGPAQRWAFCVFDRLEVNALCGVEQLSLALHAEW